jgi:hypothetical protein
MTTTTLSHTPVNQQKLALLERALAEILAEALRRGFHGTAGVELCVQDGTIQHIRRRVERIEK